METFKIHLTSRRLFVLGSHIKVYDFNVNKHQKTDKDLILEKLRS